MTTEPIEYYELNIAQKRSNATAGYGATYGHWARVTLPRDLTAEMARIRATAIARAIEAASPGGCFAFDLIGIPYRASYPQPALDLKAD